ncbi:histidine kinase [Sinomicrobium sp. FJxs]|uniref:Histidine kinase n=1 Tax=Sinomicrobium weinanense TaxID=2842200 RepID=A0A926JUQ5_9FLAO|nr:histidine kinase [Sinomicrobium weinanense]
MRLFYILLLTLLFGARLNAQVELRTEYIGSSGFRDEDNKKTGGKGDAKIFSVNARIPFSVKMNENNRPTVWGMSIGGSYTSFNNENMDRALGPDEIMNAQIGLFHMRPISERWSILAMLGAGVYTSHTEVSDVGLNNVLGNGGVIFIWHLKDNLDLGLGPVINTLLGYPMVFPGIYFNWELNGRYELKASAMNGLAVSAGVQLREKFMLKLIAELNGALALEKINGKKMMFTHSYFVAGLQPEFMINKSFSISATAGISAGRNAYYQERNLKSVFKSDDEKRDPRFTAAPYFSLGLKYGF